MRPVRRGPSQRSGDFADYQHAKPDLLTALGSYCSYCERRLATQIHVEHIQAKSDPQYGHLIGRWENFLLSCVNCNSCKQTKDVRPAEVLLPDRDNTFAAFAYLQNGAVEPATGLRPKQRKSARATLAMVGLRSGHPARDSNGRLVAADRRSQAMEAWSTALEAKSALDSEPSSNLRKQIVATAMATGFFSIWMTVFAHDPDMKQRLIDAFPGTRESGCFDPRTGDPISPAPNPDKLPDGGKV